MAKLGYASIRARINEAYAGCRSCNAERCDEQCAELVQCELDVIIARIMQQAAKAKEVEA